MVGSCHSTPNRHLRLSADQQLMQTQVPSAVGDQLQAVFPVPVGRPTGTGNTACSWSPTAEGT